MSDRELRSFQRALRLRRERRRRIFFSALAVLAATCLTLVGCVFYSSIRTNAGSGFKYYTNIVIEPGETLWSLADDYMDQDHYRDRGQYIAEVQSINHLDEKGTVFAGQMLVVPYYSDVYVE